MNLYATLTSGQMFTPDSHIKIVRQYVAEQTAALRAELAAERKKLDTILTDVNYIGGIQDLLAQRSQDVVEWAKAEAELAAARAECVALVRTSASYSNLEVIDREALRKAVEALADIETDIVNNYWGPYSLKTILDKSRAALAQLTKGQP